MSWMVRLWRTRRLTFVVVALVIAGVITLAASSVATPVARSAPHTSAPPSSRGMSGLALRTAWMASTARRGSGSGGRAPFGFSSRAQSAGVKGSETTAEMQTEMAMVRANWL